MKEFKIIRLLLILSLTLGILIPKNILAKELTEGGLDFLNDSITESLPYNSKKSDFDKYQKRLYKSVSYTTYKDIMNYKWIDITEKKTNEKLSIDISVPMSGKEYYSYLDKLSSHDGVSLFEIGSSSEGLPMEAIEIDFAAIKNPKVICLTGSIHSREHAGYVYILKQLTDLINGYEKGDKEAVAFLEKYVIAAIPCCNPDMIFYMTENKDKYDKNGNLWKANAKGIDLNRNFPSLMSGILKNGNTKHYTAVDTAGYGMYAGILGSAPETRAMMKWTYYYVAYRQCDYYITYHQQGRVIYAGQSVQNSSLYRKEDLIRTRISNLTGYKSIGSNSKTTIPEKLEALNGTGDGACGYATSVALAKYDIGYGNFVWLADDGSKYCISEYPDLDSLKAAGIKPVITNDHLKCFTIEFGNGNSYLGGSKTAYKNNALEYKNKHIDKLLYLITEQVLLYETTKEK